MALRGGRNLAMKVPPTEWSNTVTFYRDVIGLPVIHSSSGSITFEFGSNRLWIDSVDGLQRAEIWLEIISDALESDEDQLTRACVTRCDDVETLPEQFPGFWIRNPAGLVHLVTSSE